MQNNFNIEDLECKKNTVNTVINMYVGQNYSIITIARTLHITYYQVRQILVDNGIKLRTKNNKISI